MQIEGLEVSPYLCRKITAGEEMRALEVFVVA